ncbi:MAG TPA: hydrogenase formation protein HypD [Candidatus Omnitrophica bacterium]|nr:hydrogenase formation protein HypD [Candidatus Omnitrophota bacterium]
MNSSIKLNALSSREKIISAIKRLSEKYCSLNFMEVCGTHTMEIYRAGIPSLISGNIKLISGPGCPVCVTSENYVDMAISYLNEGYNILTFGDMFRVPGSKGSLETEGSGKVKIIYSPDEALEFAEENCDKKIILLAVGFETTAPLFASILKEIRNRKITNLYLLCSLKLIPPAIEYLLSSGEVKIDGFLLPGHVSAIIGTKQFQKICRQYKIPGVVSGFEPQDILESIFMLLLILEKKEEYLKIQYARVVKEEGNPLALKEIEDVFEMTDADWRGIGSLKNSGLKIRKEFQDYDIQVVHPIRVKSQPINPQCKCGEVLKGIISPRDCPLFGKLCSPQTPQGPCMVSSEGACAAIYKYGRE